MKVTKFTLLAAGLLTASTASAVISIVTIQVGNAGNAGNAGKGSVGYDYHIGAYEVTNSQYTAFLNATAATDTHGLYSSNMSSSKHGGITRAGNSGSYTYSVKSDFGDKPVNYVSFWDAARFSNWLTTGGTESGVYNLNGTTAPTNNTITRDATAWSNGGVAIASEDEWYKAAFYDGNDGYTLYPSQSESFATANANYNNSVGTVTDIGTYAADPSYYGTFDQGGNVWEWNDTTVTDLTRGRRGGSFSSGADRLQSSFRAYGSAPTFGEKDLGFRVSSLAPIPEPSTYAAIFSSLALAIAIVRRKGRGTL